ncbi:hybrid sensor histidine kinase/response regulator [Siphonobacter aquaeclarae]|uniref:histidine kinase n=1 Tax=Siphonobacter aquaeclarae TaxID=563176 RepID=A0A1G9X798_9BACT|nr:hybrid sensor histidine kinase/response regulator [Siphonobacter aquaeclarae]SDM92356.1 PAS domain S-box-containing protein [Siphonobacter aquaeclarae]
MSEITRVLIVDDDEDDFLLTTEYLRDIPGRQFQTDWVNGYAVAMEKIDSQTHDIVFVDFYLGAKTGLDLIEEAHQRGIFVPMVLLTGRGDRRVDEEATRRGAMDYLVKRDLDAEKLERCIRYALERAATLNSLRESELRYRSLFNQLREMIFLATPDGTFLYVNPNGTELLGYSSDEFRTRRVPELFESTDRYALFSGMLDQFGEIEDFEVALVTNLGEKRYCTIYASLQPDGFGSQQIQGIVHDITARKKAERDALLSEKVAATARLVRTLAHEVRNPLTNINLSADELVNGIDDENLSVYPQIIKRNSQRINDLISELLNSSRQTEMSLAPYPIHQILDETLSLALDRIQLKSISLEKEYGEDCLVRVDKEKIKIALLNIVVNAIEAMEPEAGVLRIGNHVAGENCYVLIQDNGAGIPAEHLGRLFEPYFTSKNNGIGLGLAATLSIVQSHKASIDVESEVGRGTAFTIHFPLAGA